MNATADSHHHLNVLIVDDNEDAADSLEAILRVWGYSVLVAYNGEEALKSATTTVPDCILLDINMPRMDGFEVAEKIRQRPAMSGVKIVALTAYSDAENIRKMATVGFNYYLNKTCQLSDIRRLLDTYDSRRHEQSLA
jgi:two-component system, OmpR family, response regulator